jgi:hypothetical protein
MSHALASVHDALCAIEVVVSNACSLVLEHLNASASLGAPYVRYDLPSLALTMPSAAAHLLLALHQGTTLASSESGVAAMQSAGTP